LIVNQRSQIENSIIKRVLESFVSYSAIEQMTAIELELAVNLVVAIELEVATELEVAIGLVFATELVVATKMLVSIELLVGGFLSWIIQGYPSTLRDQQKRLLYCFSWALELVAILFKPIE
jgi:hypothetical protein